MPDILLYGITWGHSRGITPLQAASQRYGELHPGVEIRWKKRSLQEFADMPIEQLTREYDLLIIDHPWAGCADATRCVLPLEEHLPPAYLEDQRLHSTGRSHESYIYNDHQWALAIDAATPAASYRADLFAAEDVPLPATWDELLQLARRGKVAVPAIPIDLLMNFYSFCIATGERPFGGEEEVVTRSNGITALQQMKELYSLVDPSMFTCNPIAVAERMSSTDEFWYCPFAYGYSNYSRTGYAKHLLHYTDTVLVNDQPLHTTIGGTGLAVSAFSQQKEIALDFAMKVCSPEWQRTLYVQHGGQPGHRSAWLDAGANELTHDYFRSVLPLMERGYMRPRYNGYLYFQDHAGQPVQDFLMGRTTAEAALDDINELYRQSLTQKAKTLTA